MRAAVVLAVLVLVARPAGGQNSEPKIWSGVFTSAQAERGRAVVATHCIQCHGQNRSFNDDLFMLHWEGHNVARLFRKIRDSMPPKRMDVLSDAQRIDIVAYLLEQNGFPAGETELVGQDDVLESLQILPREGPRPMRNGAFVQVNGCLAEVAAFRWQITKATEPVPVALEEPLPSDATSGDQTFNLLSPFPSPAPHVGRIVNVRGLLIRNPSGNAINVVRLEPIGPACAQ